MIYSPFITNNTSLAGVAFACLGLFLISFLRQRQCIITLVIFIITGIIYLQSRAGFLSFTVGILTLAFVKNWIPALSKIKKTLLSVFILVLILGSAFLIKENSTAGRLFIWKNCFKALESHWLLGAGWGSFRGVYNEQQANWFMLNGFANNEALLADTVYYAFNEWLQLALEIGVPLTVFIAGFVIYVFSASVFKLKELSCSSFCYGAVASYAGLLSSSLVSYPFYFLPTLILFLFLFIWLLFFIADKNTRKLILKTLFSLVLLIIALYSYFQCYARILWKDASDYTRISYHLKAKEKLMEAYPVLKSNGDYLFTLGKAYLTINQKDSALYYFKRSAVYKNDYDLHKKMGELYYETGDLSKAEYHYLKAVYMVPNRFRSREALIDFYIKTGEKQKALEWSVASLNFPIKIPSAQVFKIRRRFELFLQTEKW